MSIEVTAYVEVDDVLDDLSTDDLIQEIQRRAGKGDLDAAKFGGASVLGLGPWDTESLICAIQNDDGRRVVDLLRPVFHQ
jgi:hypothetical protein